MEMYLVLTGITAPQICVSRDAHKCVPEIETLDGVQVVHKAGKLGNSLSVYFFLPTTQRLSNTPTMDTDTMSTSPSVLCLKKQHYRGLLL